MALGGMGCERLHSFHSINPCYTCVRERTQPLDAEQAPKNSHCQNTAGGMYINIQSYARSHIVSKHLPDHPNPLPSHSQAIISLLAQVQVHGIDPFLHSSPECRQSLFINNSNCIHSYLCQADPVPHACKYFIKFSYTFPM